MHNGFSFGFHITLAKLLKKIDTAFFFPVFYVDWYNI